MIRRHGVFGELGWQARSVCLIGSAIVVLGLASCATWQGFNTPTGQSGVTIRGVTKQQVSDVLQERLFNRGWKIETVNDRTVIASKQRRNNATGSQIGSRSDSVTDGRVTYNLLDVKGGIRVVAKLEIIMNPGTESEQVTDATNTESGANMRDTLREISAALSEKQAATKTTGLPRIPVKDGTLELSPQKNTP